MFSTCHHAMSVRGVKNAKQDCKVEQSTFDDAEDTSTQTILFFLTEALRLMPKNA